MTSFSGAFSAVVVRCVVGVFRSDLGKPTVHLTVAEMHAIINRWRDEVHQAGHSLPAMRRFVYRLAAADAPGEADVQRMAEEFKAILAEVPPETAERLRLLDAFVGVLHESEIMLQAWSDTLNEAEAGGWPGRRRR